MVDDGCPGLKLYDKLLERIAFGGAAYYDNMRGDGKSALEYATRMCLIANFQDKEKGGKSY